MASRNDPAAVNSQATMLMPPNAASDAGSRKMPDPIMLPTTSAVVVGVPSLVLVLIAHLRWLPGTTLPLPNGVRQRRAPGGPWAVRPAGPGRKLVTWASAAQGVRARVLAVVI